MQTKSSLGFDMVKLSISRIISVAISLATAMLLSRYCTLVEYGTYSQLLIMVNITCSIFTLGLPNSINYFLGRADSKEEKQKFMSIYYLVSTLLGFIMGLSLVLSLPLFKLYFKNELLLSFAYFVAVYPWASTIDSSISNVLVAYKKTKLLLFYRLLLSFCLLFAVLSVVLFKLSFNLFIFITLIVHIVFSIFAYIISAVLANGFKIAFDWSFIKAIFFFSIPIGLSTLVGTLDIELDKLIIGAFTNTETLAVYTNSSKELPLTMIAVSITAVLLPKVARLLKDKNGEEAVRLWGASTELSLIIMSLFAFGIFTFAEEAMSILYSEKYLSGVSVFRIYTIALLFRSTYIGLMLNASGKTKKILLSSIFALVLNLALNPVLYLLLGIIGPAIATIISILITAIIQLIWTSKEVAVSFKRLFPWKRFGLILIINSVFAISFWLIKYFVPLEIYLSSIGEALLMGAIWGIIYVVVFWKRISNLWKAINIDVEAESVV